MGIVKEYIKRFRDAEILRFQRDMFWHESEKQKLIEELLLKIYALEDKVKELQDYKK